MQQHYINNNKNKLIIFFAGWGCDENQFANYNDENFDILIMFNYSSLDLNFDFTKYEQVHLIGYSAGVFIGTLVKDKIPNLVSKIAINGNPYIFDEKQGLSAEKLAIFNTITAENYVEFRRKYMVVSDEEFKLYSQYESQRKIESSSAEADYLVKLYAENKANIKPDFDTAILAEFEPFFELAEQRKFYGDKLKIVPNSKHHLFFNFKSFEDILNF